MKGYCWVGREWTIPAVWSEARQPPLAILCGIVDASIFLAPICILCLCKV